MAKQDQRNPVARAAILRKGGAHEKCSTAKRQHDKQELKKTVSSYLTEDKATTDSGRFLFLLTNIRFFLPIATA
ncbi:MAG: hypothetical protein V3U78_02345 [Thiotrichaceae bacterium]